MKYKLWSEQDDYKLWSLRSKPTYQLAEIFNKTTGAIQSRIKHLNDPKHKAHQRLFKNYGYIMATSEHDGNTILDKAMISEEQLQTGANDQLPLAAGQRGS